MLRLHVLSDARPPPQCPKHSFCFQDLEDILRSIWVAADLFALHICLDMLAKGKKDVESNVQVALPHDLVASLCAMPCR